MIDQALAYAGLLGGLVLALLVFAFYKAEWSKEQFMKNWYAAEGKKKSVFVGAATIILIPVLIGIVLHTANAETKYFDGAKVFVGLDSTPVHNAFCQKTGASDRISSNMGFVQNIATTTDFNIGMKYTHHSCAISPDVNTYDAIGIVIEWTIY